MATKNDTKPARKKTQRQTRPLSTQAGEPRKLKGRKYKSFRLQPRIKNPAPKLPNSFRLLARALKILGKNWILFGGILAIYGMLSLVFVANLSSAGDLTAVKSALKELGGGDVNPLVTGGALLAYMVGDSGGGANASTGAYQILLLIIISLVLIWTLRQVMAGVKVTIRDSYYKSTYPLIPFVLVMAVCILQFLPLVLGMSVYGIISANDIAVYAIEKIVWAILIGLLGLLSLYMLCSSVFATYIATLPDMTPLKALRSARQLVLHRRWTVLRRVLFLPLVVVIGTSVVMLPILLFVTPAAPVALFVLSVIDIAIIHSYMYTLYRELL